MTGLVSYSVTLYRLFCEATGAGGTTQRVASNNSHSSDGMVTVNFYTRVAAGMPWRFVPVQKSVRVRLGEDTLVFFEAENLSDAEITGHAAFNVTPDAAGSYFKKIQCFCFTEEKLAAHQIVQMPVDFYVDPRFGTDPDTKDVHNITLSYTFFTSLKPEGAPDLARFIPDAEAGGRAFAEACSGCHQADHNAVGPRLAGIVGRPAGSTPGYPYSAALSGSAIVWDTETLDRWLTDPQRLVPGAQMPMKVAEPATRRDIIAYLKTMPAPQRAAAVPGVTPPG